MNSIYLLIFIVLFNLFSIFFVKNRKYFIFKHRRNIFFKLFYSRIYKISIPLLLLIDGNFVFDLLKNYKIKEWVFYFNVLFIGWLFYEIIKYIIYVIIAINLSHKTNVRKEVFNLSISFYKTFYNFNYFYFNINPFGGKYCGYCNIFGCGRRYYRFGGQRYTGKFF